MKIKLKVNEMLIEIVGFLKSRVLSLGTLDLSSTKTGERVFIEKKTSFFKHPENVILHSRFL